MVGENEIRFYSEQMNLAIQEYLNRRSKVRVYEVGWDDEAGQFVIRFSGGETPKNTNAEATP